MGEGGAPRPRLGEAAEKGKTEKENGAAWEPSFKFTYQLSSLVGPFFGLWLEFGMHVSKFDYEN